MRAGDRELVVASYNVHRCIGRDRVHAPERVGRVLRELGADVVALQEVSARKRAEGVDQFQLLGEATGLEAVPGLTLWEEGGELGNALLTRLEVAKVDRVDLSIPGCEPRGALDVRLVSATGEVRVVATHLGLRRPERRLQVQRLLECIDRDPAPLLILLGDMNEWLPRRATLQPLHARFGLSRSPRTFPAWRPLFALDRIWVSPRASLASLDVHRSPLAREASDHLPLRARVRPGPQASRNAGAQPAGSPRM